MYNIKIERGSGITSPGATMPCTGFTASSTAYDGLLSAVRASWAAPGLYGKAAAGTWATSDTVDYRFTISANDDATANAHEASPAETFATASFSSMWEARNTGSTGS